MRRQDNNPLLAAYGTPFDTPPFDRIKPEHYEPAFRAAIEEARAEIDAITENGSQATFENTIEALEYSGKRLSDISNIFYNLTSAETNDALEAIAECIQPEMTAFSNDVSLNEKLFGRVREVYESRDTLALNKEQAMLLEKTYKRFARNGAALSPDKKDIYRRLTNELAENTLKFGQNVLAATNAYSYHISPDRKHVVKELPGFVRETMAYDAKQRGLDGWLVTLHAPSLHPFLSYSSNREIKEEVWRKSASRAFGGEHDNSQIVKRIVELRHEIAVLLGYGTFADYVLEERMAENAGTVNTFLRELLDASKKYAEEEYRAIEDFASDMAADKILESNVKVELKPWDWAYFSEKYKNMKYALNEELVKPYLKLENVEKGVFMLAEKLFDLSFTENKEIPVYHPDVKTYEVRDKRSGKFMAVLYVDFFPREGKRNGAWMTSFREMYTNVAGEEVRPLVSLCCNFTKPTETSPSLLTFDEFTTFLHEFGHGLHGILAEGRYPSLTGTNVYRDFVELPSQLLENWATEKEFLDMFAVHYKTGEPMPQELVDKIIASKTFLAAYANVRQLSFGMSDMAWHSITGHVEMGVDEFENVATRPTRLYPPVEGTCMSTSFSHIFAGGYAAGYYSYKWAEVLEADAFSLFKEKGIFDREVAGSLRENILSKGGSEHPMTLYVRFRGHKPDVDALLTKMGVKK